MTKLRLGLSDHTQPMVLEIKKTSSGAVLSVVGIMSVTELSGEAISLASHSGRLRVSGTDLVLSVFENRCVEISGKIEGVDMGYGKRR